MHVSGKKIMANLSYDTKYNINQMYLDLLYNKSGITVRFITMFNYVVLSPLTLFCDGLERLEQFTSRCLSYIAVLWSVLMIILPINYTITLNKRFASHLVDIFLFCFLFCYIFVVSLFYIICVILCCLSSIHPKNKGYSNASFDH